MPAGKINRVAVVGAGIVGASIAYNLSKRGCDVILIDKKGPHRRHLAILSPG